MVIKHIKKYLSKRQASPLNRNVVVYGEIVSSCTRLALARRGGRQYAATAKADKLA